METKKTPYYYLSGQRSVLMGLAILWVLWFHAKMHLSIFPWHFLNTGVGFLRDIGYGGVDIFLLVSGMGIYQSLEKNEVSVYFKNRLKKILPVWWSLMLVTFLVKYFLFGVPITIRSSFGVISLTSYWLELPNRGNWYVYAIMLFYLVSPVLYSLLKNSKRRKLTLLLMLLAAFCVSIPFMGGNNHLMAVSRVPIYLLGMYFCAEKDKMEMTRGKWWLCLGAFLIGLAALGLMYHFWKSGLRNYGFYWWPFLLIAPAGSLLVARFFERFQKPLRALSAGLSAIGKASLEILLTSDILFFIVKKKHILIGPKNLTWLIAITAAVIVGLLVHELIELCKKKCGEFISLRKRRSEENA